MDKDKRIKELEKELEVNKKLIEQFKGLLDCIPDPVFMKDENLLWIYGNPTILNLYNIDSNNYIGKAEDELLPKEFAESCMKSDERARDAKTISKSEERARDEKNTLHYYEVFKVPFYDNDEFKGLIGVGRDITETKKVKEELEKALVFQKILTQQAKMASLGEMLENIIHQWRQPLSVLSAITTNTQLKINLGLDLEKDEILKDHTNILKYVNYMNQTIEDFRNYFIDGKEKESFNITDAIEQSLLITNGSMIRHKITINKNLTDDITYCGYKNELVQVILNILNNSKDALIENKIENKYINLDLDFIDGNIVIKIADNAKGIPKSIISNIFESHFTTKKENGSGIGLYMSLKIVKDRFNGNIKVSNEKDGAMFQIIFPNI